jgi:hypothetical protein
MVTEKQIIAHAKKTAKELGLRFLRISMRPGVEVGWADSFILGPNRHLLGLETKRLGKPATPMQIERGKTLVAYGFAWAKCDSKDDVDFTLINFAKHCVGQPLMTREEFEAL